MPTESLKENKEMLTGRSNIYRDGGYWEDEH